MAISNQVVPKNNVASFNEMQIDVNTYTVLKETLYPGSTDQEVAMILSYCKARRIDPILKPVHLVPMSVKTDKKDNEGKFIYARKNVIMPGIGLYRIDASRSGTYAGVSEPEFGEEVTQEFGEKVKKKVTFPKWAKITVKKILSDGSIAQFTAKEFWLENYASKSKFDNTPNDMWEKRAYGQIAKCAEAQALRKAWPDIVGNEYTKEEMEGKHFQDEPIKEVKSKIYENELIESHEIDKDIINMSWAENLDDLQEIYKKAYKYWASRKDKENLKKLIDAKDKRKDEIEANANTKTEEKVDLATGEVSNEAV